MNELEQAIDKLKASQITKIWHIQDNYVIDALALLDQYQKSQVCPVCFGAKIDKSDIHGAIYNRQKPCLSCLDEGTLEAYLNKQIEELSVRIGKEHTDLKLAEEQISSLQAEVVALNGHLIEKQTEIEQIVSGREVLKAENERLKKPKDFPKVICLCGSTRFYEQFMEQNYLLSMAGKIVLSVGFFMHRTDTQHGQIVGCTPEQKLTLDELHKRKIDLADEIFILNVGGYIGQSTKSEIDYAIKIGKPVDYLETLAPPDKSDNVTFDGKGGTFTKGENNAKSGS